jgi:quercetin dioxygenase-like cupin family protein
MKQRRLSDMIGGWMVGDFDPHCLRTPACEVACKHYEAGATEALHVHRVATELTLVVSGEVRMAGRTLRAGDILVLDPGEAADFEALTAATTVVVKLPSVAGDKYLVPAPVPGGPGALS